MWDGDDGWPVVYHGRTFTSKVSFKTVVEVINESAFVSSPYPVILSIENRCSLPQQVKMAQIFISVLGDKLVKSYLFESDLNEDCPLLPSPNQLKYKILIKNKKLQRQPIQQQLSIQQQHGVNGNASSGNATNQQAQLQHQLSQQQQNSPPAHHQQLSRKQLSDASKSSILQTQLSQQQHETTGINQNGSGKKDFGADSSSPSTGSASNKGENGIVKKIRTISTRLTAAAAEPKIKQNVVSFIHKSKSLTDNAFNKIAAGRNGNGSKVKLKYSFINVSNFF